VDSFLLSLRGPFLKRKRKRTEEKKGRDHGRYFVIVTLWEKGTSARSSNLGGYNDVRILTTLGNQRRRQRTGEERGPGDPDRAPREKR